MKQQILLFFLLVIGSFASAQQFEGIIRYTEVVDLSELHERMSQHNPMFAQDLPKERSGYSILYVKGSESLYTRDQEAMDNQAASDDRSHRFMMRMAGNDETQIYRNTDEDIYIEEKTFFDKKFLINGPPKEYTWKMTGEQMQVGSYVCMKATSQDSSEKIVAWFTPQIPVSLGPAHYAGLPGLVLHVDINDGSRTLTAQGFELGEISNDFIAMPDKGKEVTREEFDEIVRKKMEEMRESRGSGGHPGMMITTRRQD